MQQSFEAWDQALYDWFGTHRRELPWRSDPTPYRVWVSEIMLQQTRIEAVTGYFERFMCAFPTVEALAAADEGEVLRLWAGLGYYSRARNLHKAARQITAMGGFPTEYDAIRALPGVGDYTAAAVYSIALHKPAAAVDGNVLRVMARLYALTDNVLEPAAKKKIAALVEAKLPPAGEGPNGPGAFTEALMELGETVCVPGEPRCEICPWGRLCRARQTGMEKTLPVREKKQKRTQEHRVAALIKNNNGAGETRPDGFHDASQEVCVFMIRRPQKGLLAGMWELPNALIAQESLNAPIAQKSTNALTAQEPLYVPVFQEQPANAVFEKQPGYEALVRAETGLPIRLGRYLGCVKHVFTHKTWLLEVYEAVFDEPVLCGAETADASYAAARYVSVQSPEVAVPAPFKKAAALLGGCS